ncbi:Holliday junction DNA helicase subunit RuvA [Micrococcales bacterium KH10]|nr:Holliday junction DNA helicase subunit RuvA [Micrococcales bacterium KH10]
MIASLTGTVAMIRLDSAIINVGGVGYLVLATPTTLSSWRVDETVTVATSLVVREDSMTMFGFAEDDERAVFETLQTVSGIGPRLALAMLAVHTPDQLRRAVATEDLAALQRVPGVGRKSAQRLVLELAGKLGEPQRLGESMGAATSTGAAGQASIAAAVAEALLGLGWPIKAAEAAVAEAIAALPEESHTDRAVILRDALRVLGGNRG